MPGHPVVVVAHPLASKVRDDVGQMAQEALEEIVNALTTPRAGTA